MQSRIITLTVATPSATLFNFLADIEHLPHWSGGFCEWIELHREGWWAYTALGELEVASKVDDIAGTIDLRFAHSAGWKLVIPLRVRTDCDGGAIIRLSCVQPTGMTDDDYERLLELLLAGLRGFSGQFRAELAVA